MIFEQWPAVVDLADMLNLSEGAAQSLLDAVSDSYGEGKDGLECLRYVVRREMVLSGPEKAVSWPKYFERLALYKTEVPTPPPKEPTFDD
jgi:hypothetical protein